MNNLIKEVGTDVKLLRVEKGLTQTPFAKKVGISVPTLSSIERGYGNVSLKSLVKIYQAFGERISFIRE